MTQESPHTHPPMTEPRRTRKEGVYAALNDPANASHAGQLLYSMLTVLIVLNALLVFVVFDNRIDTFTHHVLYLFDAFCTVIFLIEYLCRIWTADLAYPHLAPLRARIRYLLSPMGIIDFLAVVPFIGVFLGIIPYQTINTLRVLRVIRLIKITRYIKGLNLISRVISNHKQEIVPAFAVLMVLIVVASVLMYQFENPVQPENFDSLFSGMYWAITTITSTGYGDLVPITVGGRLVGFLTMFCSIGIVAIPAGIFTAGFIEEARAEHRERVERPDGTKRAEDEGPMPEGDAKTDGSMLDEAIVVQDENDDDEFHYCPYCGKRLP